MCEVGRSGYIILLIILIILYKYIYIILSLCLRPRMTKALFLQLQIANANFSAWHSGSVVAWMSLWKWSEGRLQCVGYQYSIQWQDRGV